MFIKLHTLGFSGWSVFPTQLVCSSSCSSVGCKRVLPEKRKNYRFENATHTEVKTMKWIRKFRDSFQSLCDLLCVSLWTGPPIHKLAAKLDDLRASLSLTSSSTRCRSLDASDWDSSNKSPAGNREILSLSGTTSLYYISTCTVIFKHMINFGEKFCGRSTAFDESETKHSD